MRIAIMQPYIFPYIGYFQLIHSVDKFVFYDDVNFIKRGWINRNRILVNNEPLLFTIPLSKASQNKSINEIKLAIDEKWLSKFYLQLEHSYKKAPHFDKAFLLVKEVMEENNETIADLSVLSVRVIADYLNLDCEFELSSKAYSITKGLEKADRLIKICESNGADTYVNPSGGQEIYSKQYFSKNGVDLKFIENKIEGYKQFGLDFQPALSIIDLLMFSSKEGIIDQLSSYKLN